jgi:hypothetical protein
VAAVVLTPGEFAADERVDGRQRVGQIIAGRAEILLAEQPVGGAGEYGGHEATSRVHPIRVARRDPVADEARPRGAQRNQLMLVHRQVGHGFLAKRRVVRRILQEVAGHPVVFAAAGQVLQKLAEVAAKQLGASRAGGGDEPRGDPPVEGRGDQRGLAVPRHAGDAHLGGIDARVWVGFEVVDESAHAPGPGAQRAPVVGPARLALVRQADDAFAQAVVVRLNAVRIDRAVAPAIVECLLRPGGRPATAGESAAKPERELQDDRHAARGMLRHGEARLNGDLDFRKAAVVHVADERLGHRRNTAAFGFHGVRNFPFHRRDVLGDSAVHLALKILDDFRAALRPLVGRLGFRAVLKRQERRHGLFPRIGGCFVGRIIGSAVAAPARRLDAELAEHVLIVVVVRGDPVGLFRLRPLRRCLDVLGLRAGADRIDNGQHHQRCDGRGQSGLKCSVTPAENTRKS